MIGPVALERTRFWAYLIKNPHEFQNPSINDELMFGIEPGQEGKMASAIIENTLRTTVIRSLMEIPQRGPMTQTTKDIKAMMSDSENFFSYITLKLREETFQSVYQHYYSEGSQNFFFGKNLVNEFLETDTSDILIEELSLPYSMAYYKFEGQDFLTTEGQIADGMFIGRSDKYMMVLPVSSEIGEPWFNITEKPCCVPPGYLIVNESGNLTIEDGLYRSHDLIKSYYDTNIEELIAAVKDTETLKGLDVFDYSVGNARELVSESLEKCREQIPRLAQILSNALLIIDGEGVTSRLKYEDSAPKDLAEKATSNRPGANKAEKKLKAQGFVSLRHYEVPDQMAGFSSKDSEGRQVTPHYRRGHWRKQRYGVGLSQTKRIRIAPVIVKGWEEQPAPRKGYKIK